MKLLERHRVLKELTHKTVSEIVSKDGFSEFSNVILQEIIISCLKNYQKKLNVGVQDSVHDLLDNLKKELKRLVFDISEEWSIITSHDKIIFPENCRFFYKKGQSFLVVIEQKPHVRSLSFDKEILGKFKNTSKVRSRKDRTELIQLSLPYIVFVFHFKNLSKNSSSAFFEIQGFYSGWRKKSLSSFEDELYHPLLPNIHTNLNICMGHKWSLKGDNISNLVNKALTDYWSSVFNDDLSDFWWEKRNYDNRFTTAYSWAEETKSNSDFILSANFGKPYKKLENLVNLCVLYEEEPDKNVIEHRLSDLIDDCTSDFFNKIMRFFKRTKFERYYPKEAKSLLEKEISVLADEMTDLILCLDNEVQKLSRYCCNSEIL